MDSDIVSRLKELMQYNSLNSLTLSKILGYKSSEKVSRLFRDEENKAKPSYDIIYDISMKFEISVDWLITGRGSMLREDEVQQPIQPTSATSDAVSLRLMDRLEEKDSKIDQLQSELRTMEKELAVFKSKHEHNYEHPPLTDVFTGDSSKVYGKDLAPMTKPTPSKRSSVGKT